MNTFILAVPFGKKIRIVNDETAGLMFLCPGLRTKGFEVLRHDIARPVKRLGKEATLGIRARAHEGTAVYSLVSLEVLDRLDNVRDITTMINIFIYSNATFRTVTCEGIAQLPVSW